MRSSSIARLASPENSANRARSLSDSAMPRVSPTSREMRSPSSARAARPVAKVGEGVALRAKDVGDNSEVADLPEQTDGLVEEGHALIGSAQRPGDPP